MPGTAIPKYLPSDDCKTIDGKIVVFLHPTPARAAPAAPLRSPPAGSKAAAQVAAAQAAALKSAAESGVPFCEECEQARRELARQRSS